MFDFLGRFRAAGPIIIAVLSLVAGVTAFALTSGDDGESLDATNTTLVVDPTITTDASPPSSTTSTSTDTSTTLATTTTRKPTTTTPPTTALQTLVLSMVGVGVGTPCHDAATTTTSGSGGYEIDGCFFGSFWPASESNVHVTLRSDLGFVGPISYPCHVSEGQCHGYHGLGPQERAVDQRECFWLTTSDPGWTTKSAEVCMVWRHR